MKQILTGQEALKEFNKDQKNTLSKSEQEAFDKKIQQAALDMQLSVKKCELSSLPDFIRKSNSRLYMYELDKAPEPSPTKKKEKSTIEDDYTNEFFKDIYQVICKDNSSFFVMHNGLGSRIVSDHWTEESIDKCAEMAAKLGGKWLMIPSGEPGAFPDHLREYASQAFAKQGIQFPDPTPPTAEKVAISKQKYELSSIQSDMKENIAAMRSKEEAVHILSGSDQSADNESGVTPISTTPKPY